MLKRPCAIKLIRHDLVGNQRVFARFEREVRATARLSHWNTIEIFDYGRNDDGAFYYVMEYLPGLSLADLVERFGPMPPARVIYLLRQACDALREAHDSGLIHRDIKPANLMAAYRGGHYDVTKLLDFGLVKTLSEDESVHLSQEGTVAGSPLYMAPEQVMHNQPPDRRTDIYGLGAVAYFMLTGRPPFLGETAMEVMVAHARDPVTPPSQSAPASPPTWNASCSAASPRTRTIAIPIRRAWPAISTPAPTHRTGRHATPPSGGRTARARAPTRTPLACAEMRDSLAGDSGEASRPAGNGRDTPPHVSRLSMVELRDVFGIDIARHADFLLVARQVSRADQEENAAQRQHRRDREHGDGQVGAADRSRPDRGEEPADRRGDHVGLPNRSEIQPRRIGELMSPNKWIRKMNAA